MKIQSRFKDYYDHISHRFGADPNVVYVRRPFSGIDVSIQLVDSHFFRSTLKDETYRSMEFVVAGPHVFPVIRSYLKNTVSILNKDHDPFLKKNWRGDDVELPSLPGVKKLQALVKEVGQPVFYVRRNPRGNLSLLHDIPILKDIGLPGIISPEQMWQDIYSTITNVIRPNPDKAPPVEVDNLHKIYAAGFDPKSSFRHPVNLKKLK